MLWMHDSLSEPTRLVSELNQHRMEVRKLEFFRDGTVGFASIDVSSHGTRLGEMEVPSLEEINQNSEFRGASITEQAFEELWKLHAHLVPNLSVKPTAGDAA